MRMRKIYLLSFLLLLMAGTGAQSLQWPEPTLTSRPWTRWWWLGSAVNEKDLSINLETYRKAGLGGVEITPIYGIYGAEAQFVPFLTPRWMQLLQHTLNESKRLKIGVDLANATGWPFGGPWVSDAEASKSVYYKTWSLKQGESLTVPVEYFRDSWVRTANNKTVSVDSLLQPVAKNKNLQALALDQIQFPGKLPLQSLMAYEEKGAVLDLTNKVDKEGKLNWTAPAGTWTLFGLFQGLHGKMVERAAPGGEGYAIDHFSLTAAKNYFKPFDKAFKGYDLSWLRGFFNDSYEVDDARGQANWTQHLFAEFQQRKGYDLRRFLPALFGKANPELNSRVIYDYRSVIDELILYNFTHTWKKWGSAKGKIVRNQSHGSPANTLDLYSVVDIPETEGTDVLRFKFASSAANVSGKKLVAAESATWLNEHFLSSWGDVKKAIDLYFLGGVNHIVYHGTTYSPKEVIWPGWLFYAAVQFQPSNPQWKDFQQLNTYITRVQGFLQQGKPANDILLYYPITDRYAQPGNVLLQHFDGMEKNFEKTDFEHSAKWMMEEGYGFDFFSDRQLAQFTVSGKKIRTGGTEYKTILLPASRLMELKSFQQLLSLVKAGATLLAYKDLPADVPGFRQLDSRRKQFQQLLAAIRFTHEGQSRVARLGAGKIIISDQLDLLMEKAGITTVLPEEKELRVLRRNTNEGPFWLLNNRTQKTVAKWVTLPGQLKGAALYDAMSGEIGLARTRRDEKGQLQAWIELDSFATVLLKALSVLPQKANPFTYREPAGSAIALTGDWRIDFQEGGPVIPSSLQIAALGSWTEIAGEAGKNFSGTALYTLRFPKPAAHTGRWLLNLGQLSATADVKLNGVSLGSLIGPVFNVVIPEGLMKEENLIEIHVASLMANRISWMDKNRIPWKIFYNTNMQARRKENLRNGFFSAEAWSPLPSGLMGPVTLTPLK